MEDSPYHALQERLNGSTNELQPLQPQQAQQYHLNGPDIVRNSSVSSGAHSGGAMAAIPMPVAVSVSMPAQIASVDQKELDTILTEVHVIIPAVPSLRIEPDALDVEFFPSQLRIDWNVLNGVPPPPQFNGSGGSAAVADVRVLSFIRSHPSLAASAVHFLALFKSKFSAHLSHITHIYREWTRRLRSLVVFCILCAIIGVFTIPLGAEDSSTRALSICMLTIATIGLIGFRISRGNLKKALIKAAQPVTVCGHVGGSSALLQEGQGPRNGLIWHGAATFDASIYPIAAHFNVSWTRCKAACGCPCTQQPQALPPGPPPMNVQLIGDAADQEPGSVAHEGARVQQQWRPGNGYVQVPANIPSAPPFM